MERRNDGNEKRTHRHWDERTFEVQNALGGRIKFPTAQRHVSDLSIFYFGSKPNTQVEAKFRALVDYWPWALIEQSVYRDRPKSLGSRDRSKQAKPKIMTGW